jgi:adenylate cyclase
VIAGGQRSLAHREIVRTAGQNLLISRQFAEAAVSCRPRLVSLGRHRLRGVREETELFALAS